MLQLVRLCVCAAALIVAFAADSRAQDLEAGIRAYSLGDYATALKEWRPLAEKGDPRAQHRMGLLYAQGLGVPKDPEKATDWFRKAAHKGNILAAYNLAFRYLKGEGTRKDLKMAAVWFRRAAGAGLPQAQHTLGLLFANGDGVPQNFVHAYMWLSLSAKQNNLIARKDRDAVARQMTPKQIQEAKTLVKNWRPD